MIGLYKISQLYLKWHLSFFLESRIILMQDNSYIPMLFIEHCYMLKIDVRLFISYSRLKVQ